MKILKMKDRRRTNRTTAEAGKQIKLSCLKQTHLPVVSQRKTRSDGFDSRNDPNVLEILWLCFAVMIHQIFPLYSRRFAVKVNKLQFKGSLYWASKDENKNIRNIQIFGYQRHSLHQQLPVSCNHWKISSGNNLPTRLKSNCDPSGPEVAVVGCTLPSDGVSTESQEDEAESLNSEKCGQNK